MISARNIRPYIFFALFGIYGGLFLVQESQQHHRRHYLSETLPSAVQKVSLGYLHQIGAEMLYVKAVVFLGGREDTETESYAPTLARHFQVMADLHPRFQDIYYLCESSLSWISPAYAQLVNQVLEKGIRARPDLWTLPFFVGFNYFRYLDRPDEASTYLWQAARVESAPVWIGHLATILAAEGGNIYGGLLWLKAMLAAEEDEAMKARYRVDIAEFEKALMVAEALKRYRKKYGQPPVELEDLMPEFLARLPEMGEGYELVYESQNLRLLRRRPD